MRNKKNTHTHLAGFVRGPSVDEVDQAAHVAGVNVALGDPEADVVVALEQGGLGDGQHADLHVVDAGGVGPQRHERHRVIQQVPVRTQRGMQRGGTR